MLGNSEVFAFFAAFCKNEEVLQKIAKVDLLDLK